MDKTIILREKSDDYFLKYINEDNIYNIYKKNAYNNIFFKVIRKFNLSLYIFFINKEWKHKIINYDRVIIFDSGYTNYISKYIKKKNRNIKIIMWFWNTINSINESILYDKNIDEFWTFDKNNSKEYFLNYNTQFYSLNVKLNERKIEYDSSFVGRDKGRKIKLKEIERIFKSNNLKLNLNIINNENKIISYDEYLDILSRSKTILDIVSGYQSGLSLRCLESLFLEKKLITNNIHIKDYDFYCSNNIFIIDYDDFEKISDFINKPYQKIDSKIIEKYDYANWLKNFDRY